MSAVFALLLQMSLEGGIAIFFVFAARLLLRKAPRRLVLLLWVVPLVLLLVPLRPQSPFSVQPARSASVFAESAAEFPWEVSPDLAENAPDLAENPEQSSFSAGEIGMAVWILGMAVFLGANAWSYGKVLRKVRVSVLAEKGVFLTDGLPSPFVLGLFRPKIFLPSALFGEERQLILRHERAHIRRGDHWTRVLAFAVLCAHWFHPLVWAAFFAARNDMEMACDEKALQGENGATRRTYAGLLLRFAAKGRFAAPVSFGEGGVAKRIRHILADKKPRVWISVAAVLILAVLALCLLTSPLTRPKENTLPVEFGLYVPEKYVAHAIFSSQAPEYFFAEQKNIRILIQSDVFSVEGGQGLVEYMVCQKPSYRPISLDKDKAETAGIFIPEGARKALEDDENALLFHIFTEDGIDTGGRLLIVSGELWVGRVSKETGIYKYIFQMRQENG